MFLFFQMVFVPNICAARTYGKNSAKYESTQIWNEMAQSES